MGEREKKEESSDGFGWDFGVGSWDLWVGLGSESLIERQDGNS